jgi:hypothetical protein
MNPTWLYTAAVYSVAVWRARRAGADLPWRIAALFYALVLVFLFRPMTQSYVDLPVDCLQTLSPWSNLVRHAHPLNVDLSDVAQQMVPWAHQVRESWKSFRVPLWNPRSGSGYPLLANGQSAALSPLRLIALPLSLGYSFTAEAAMKLLIALTFTYLLCRRRGYSELASSTGAVSFGFCSFLIIYLHFPHVTVACLLPAVIYALDLLAERITYRRFAFAAVIWAVLLFGGHPETAAHIFSIALGAVVWILLVERPFGTGRDAARFVVALGGALAVAALLASPFLAPLAEALPRSQRYQQVRVNPPDPYPFSDFQSFVVLIEPHFYGDFPAERQWGPATADSMSGFAGILGAAGWLALLLNAIAQRRFRTREMFFVVATPLVLGVFFGWPIIGPLFHSVLSLAANARMRLIFCFLLAMQSAAAVDLVERRRTKPLLIALASVALSFWALMNFVHFGAPWQRDGAILAIYPSLIVIAIASVAAVIATRWRASVLMVLLVAVIGEIWAIGIGWNPVVPKRLLYPRTPMIATLQKLRDAAPPASFRIAGIGPMLFPNTSAMFGLDDIRAHDPMSNDRYLGLLRVLTGYTVEDYFAMWSDAETHLLDYLNVRYLLTESRTDVTDPQRFRLIYDGRDGRIFENRHVLPRFFPVPVVVLEVEAEQFVSRVMRQSDWAHVGLLERLNVENDRERTDLLRSRPAGSPETKLNINSATETDYRMTVDAPRYSLIVSSIPWWPGWHVERNGESTNAMQVNGAFVGFVVRPGTTNVRVHFSSSAFNYGAIAALLTLAALIALSKESLRRRLPLLRQLQ